VTIPSVDVMEIEADLFLVFTGWDALTTEKMPLDQLMRWHEIALDRHKKAQDAANAG
jgi:hypothetical protein